MFTLQFACTQIVALESILSQTFKPKSIFGCIVSLIVRESSRKDWLKPVLLGLKQTFS